MAGQIYVTSVRPRNNGDGGLYGVVEVVERELARGGFDVIRRKEKGRGEGEFGVEFDFKGEGKNTFCCRILAESGNAQRLYERISTRLSALARLSGGRAGYAVSKGEGKRPEEAALLIEAELKSEPSLTGLLLVMTGMEIAGCIH